jgi:hypothetical protein
LWRNNKTLLRSAIPILWFIYKKLLFFPGKKRKMH